MAFAEQRLAAHHVQTAEHKHDPPKKVTNMGFTDGFCLKGTFADQRLAVHDLQPVELKLNSEEKNKEVSSCISLQVSPENSLLRIIICRQPGADRNDIVVHLKSHRRRCAQL